MELVDKQTWSVASIALIATKNSDCMGLEKYNRPIGDPHLQDENRINRVFIPLEMSVATSSDLVAIKNLLRSRTKWSLLLIPPE